MRGPDRGLRAKARKHKKSKKRTHQDRKHQDEQNKEEESARTLLEMKGGQTAIAQATQPNASAHASSKAVSKTQVDVDEPHSAIVLEESTCKDTSRAKKRKKSRSTHADIRQAQRSAGIERPLQSQGQPQKTPSNHTDPRYVPLEPAQAGSGVYGQSSGGGTSPSYDDPSIYGDLTVQSPPPSTTFEANGNNATHFGFLTPTQALDSRTSEKTSKRQKRQRTNDHTGRGTSASAAALASAASAANALIDPALTAPDNHDWQSTQTGVENSLGATDVEDEDAKTRKSALSPQLKRKRRISEDDVVALGIQKPQKAVVKSAAAKRNRNAGSAAPDYSAEEIATLTAVVDAYREDRGMTWSEMNDRIQQWDGRRLS